ncbi:MAG: xanthine dehydrogenase family protein molybdopterin-binding subunit, partial [Pseudomonadota bacterium]|nr:xanthine dehydrogenase family protein molybdopterin-binding subunit [Pseudomonadota bacterium]
MSEAKEYKYVGTRRVRPDGYDKVTGRANYGADLALPGMIWGKILRSPHAHAKINGIDTGKAEAYPGVSAVVTFQDFPEKSKGNPSAQNILANAKALYHGHAIAAVAAKTEQIAQEALGLIEVDYEVLPPVMDLDTAMAEGATLINENL